MSAIYALLNTDQDLPHHAPLPGKRNRAPLLTIGDSTTKRVCTSPSTFSAAAVIPATAVNQSERNSSSLSQISREPDHVAHAMPHPSREPELGVVSPSVVSTPGVDSYDPETSSSSSFVTSASPVSSRVPNLACSDRFARSRAVGQTHRDKERKQFDNMGIEVNALVQEHEFLSSLLENYLPAAQRSHRLQQFQFELANEIRQGNPFVYVVSPKTADILGTRYISAALARCFLELVAARRNVVTVCGGERRRRPTFIVPTASNLVVRIVTDTVAEIMTEADMFGKDRDIWATLCMDYFSDMHLRWHEFEKTNDAADPEDHLEKQDRSSSVSKNGRGKGVKRCSRCNKLKTAGSGHGRSKCDDHQLIGSSIPYPAIAQA